MQILYDVICLYNVMFIDMKQEKLNDILII